jgi:hypothetical protein
MLNATFNNISAISWRSCTRVVWTLDWVEFSWFYMHIFFLCVLIFTINFIATLWNWGKKSLFHIGTGAEYTGADIRPQKRSRKITNNISAISWRSCTRVVWTLDWVEFSWFYMHIFFLCVLFITLRTGNTFNVNFLK